MKNKARVEVSDILPLALTLVVAGIAIAFGIDVTDDVRDGQGETDCAARTDDYTNYNADSNLCTNVSNAADTTAPTGAAFTASGDTITGVAKFSSKMSLIATVIVAAIVIGLLVRFMFMRT